MARPRRPVPKPGSPGRVRGGRWPSPLVGGVKTRPVTPPADGGTPVVISPAKRPPTRTQGVRVFSGTWKPAEDGTDKPRRKRKRNITTTRTITRVRNPQPRNKGKGTGASQVNKKRKRTASLITNSDQGGGLSGVTNGPGGLDGGLFDSITSSLGSFARLAVLAIGIYLAWKYGRKYLR